MCIWYLQQNAFYFKPSTKERGKKKYDVDDKGYREGSNPTGTRRYVGRKINIPQTICPKYFQALINYKRFFDLI